MDTHIKLDREDKKNLHKALWNIYQPVDAEDWKTVDKIKDEHLKIIKRIQINAEIYLHQLIIVLFYVS